MQWLMLQRGQPEDFVIATGPQVSERQFILWAAQSLGITLHFEDQGLDDVGTVAHVESEHAPALQPVQTIVRVAPYYDRPAEVEILLGDPSKVREQLGWTPQTTAQQMCIDKVHSDWLIAHNKSPGSPRAVPQPDLFS